MTDIVCLSHRPWQAPPSRTQQLLSRMGDDARVLFFEPPAAPKDNAHKQPGRETRPGLTVYTLPPGSPLGRLHPMFTRQDSRRAAAFIQSKIDRHRMREPLLWVTAPEHVHLLDFLAYRGLVYDCDRYWTTTPLRWESDLALEADVIFAASGGLHDRLSPCNENIAVLPNGANHPMFARGRYDTPAELAGVSGPILGFVGTVHADLDVEPLIYCAQLHPDWHFVLLGSAEHGAAADAVQAVPNILLTGAREPLEVPDYIAQFHVCLDLRRRSAAGDDVTPVRVYEYLSAGKPVVRMCFPGQAEDYPDITYSAYDAEGFAAACERALYHDAPWKPGQRRDCGATCAWSARADNARRILELGGLI